MTSQFDVQQAVYDPTQRIIRVGLFDSGVDLEQVDVGDATVTQFGSLLVASWALILSTGAASNQTGVEGAGTRIMWIDNATDVTIRISFDAGTTVNKYIPPGGSWTVDFAMNGREFYETVHARPLTSNASSGSLYIAFMK